MPRTLRRWSFLKKSPRHLGDDPGGPPERYPHRTMVAGRGARGPEEQDRAPLGPTRHPAPRFRGLTGELVPQGDYLVVIEKSLERPGELRAKVVVQQELQAASFSWNAIA